MTVILLNSVYSARIDGLSDDDTVLRTQPFIYLFINERVKLQATVPQK